MKESEIVKQILTYLKANGFLAWRVPLGGVLQAGGKFRSPNPMTGHPDIAAIRDGLYYAIEVKRPEKKKNLSKEQLYWKDVLAKNGAKVIVATTVEDVFPLVF